MKKIFTENDFRSYIKDFSYGNQETEAAVLLLRRTAEIIKDDIHTVLEGVDFEPKDMKEEKLESIISEMRTICFLNGKGFDTIKLIPSKNKPAPDISAKRNGENFFIEVKCLTNIHSRKKEDGLLCHSFDDEKFFRTLDGLVGNNIEQLKGYREIEIETKKVFALVLNRSPELQCYSSGEYRVLIEGLYQKHKEHVTHVIFITGYEKEDFVCPDIS